MENEMLRWTLTVLLLLLLLFLIMICHIGFYRMARVYNWNGRRYCYLGCVPVHKENGELAVRIREHMVDLSRTTAYQIRVSKSFLKKNRYRKMLVYADGGRNYLVIDSVAMRFS